MTEAQHNVASIDAIPTAWLTPEERTAYRQRAEAGEDVYGYSSNGRWYIWDIETRIVLAPVTDRPYELVSATWKGPGTWDWTLTYLDTQTTTTVSISIVIQHPMPEIVYPAYSHRRITDIIGHCNYHHVDPTTFDGRCF